MGISFPEIILGFLQALSFGEKPSAIEPDFDGTAERLAGHRTLRVETALAWSPAEISALRVVLKSWLIVVQLSDEGGDPLPIPQSWLNGSSSTRLNEEIVAEIRHRYDALVSISQQQMKAMTDRLPLN